MMIIDANLLIYAKIEVMPQHKAARRWLDTVLSENGRIGLPWQSLLAFVRITTNRRLIQKPLTISNAWKQVEAWLECPAVWIPVEGFNHAATLRQLLTDDLKPNDVMDANLAALAIEHGLELCTADAGFARFADLRWSNPLKK